MDISSLCGPIVYFASNVPETIPIWRKTQDFWMPHSEEDLPKIQRVIRAFAHFHTIVPLGIATDCVLLWNEHHNSSSTVSFVTKLLVPIAAVDCDKVLHNALVAFIEQIVKWYQPRTHETQCAQGKYCNLPHCVCNIGQKTRVSQATNDRIESVYSSLLEQQQEEEEEEVWVSVDEGFSSEDFWLSDGYETEDERTVVLVPETPRPNNHKRKQLFDDTDTIVHETPIKRMLF